MNKLILKLALAITLLSQIAPAFPAEEKKIEIPGFSIVTPTDPGAGEEWWMPHTKPLETSRYALTNETLERPLVVTILRYRDVEEAKKAFESSIAGRPQYPQSLKVIHWDAAHRWTRYDSNEDIYLLKDKYVVGLFDLPLTFPAAKTSKLFEALADYIAKAKSRDPTNASAVAKVKLKFVKVDSEETNGEDGYGKNAVDGNPNTYWHTEWNRNSPGLPHEIIIELVPPSVIKGFTYLPRQDESDHGTIKDYEFYVSNDGTNFGEPIKKGEFETGKEEKIETFDPIKCRFIKLRAISEINGLPWTSAAEIRVIQNGEATRATKQSSALSNGD
ncbi:MAG TPA: discoidin domain-containing protein [Verrucomicrobiae bacterium]